MRNLCNGGRTCYRPLFYYPAYTLKFPLCVTDIQGKSISIEQRIRDNGKVRKSRKINGIKRQLLGAVLLSLGILNCMLALKAEFLLEPYNLVILGSGAGLLLSGLWARRGSKSRTGISKTGQKSEPLL